MLTHYKKSWLFIVALVLLAPGLKAQDTLLVKWLNEAGTDIVINAIVNTIAADTASDGSRLNPNRVYKLERGGFYYNTEAITASNFTLRLVGEPGGPGAFDNPPMLQLSHREDGSRGERLIEGNGSMVLKNLILNGKTLNGDLPYETIRFNAEGGRYEVDHVIMEYAQWGMIGVYGVNADVKITNSVFRNMLSHDQKWGGRGVSVWVDTDTLYFENNSFLNVGGFSVQVEGGKPNHFWFNQNTVVNNGRQVILGSWWTEAFVANNLFVNGFWQGEDEGDFTPERLKQPGNATSGMFIINPLPARYGLEDIRRIALTNNALYRDQIYENYYSSTSGDAFPLRAQPFLNDSTKGFIAAWENMKELNTITGKNPGLKVVPNNPDSAIQFIKDIRAGVTPPKLWYWNPGRDGGSYGNNESIMWPLPEDLSYTNSDLLTAAVDGYPLGDLNWFPTQKATWMANQQAQKDKILGLVGAAPEITPKGFVHVEDGTLSGDAEKVMATNLQAVRVAGAGEPIWKFNLSEAGNYTITVKNRTWYADNNPGRQTDIHINGSFAASVTVGIEITAELPWAESVAEAVALPAGEVELKLARSWGYLEYESVTVKNEAGDVVATLYASRCDPNGGELVCPSGDCMGGDAYVDLKTGGVEVGAEFEDLGTYIFQVDYMLLDDNASASADLTVNGTTYGNVVFDGNVLNISGIDITKANSTITFSNVSGRVGIDQINFFLVGMATSNEGNTFGVDGFELAQNYPNPFNPSTMIKFNLGAASDVQLGVYNVLGQRVAVLATGNFTSGTHYVQFDASRLASGVYFYRIDAGRFSATKKMMLIK